MASVWRNAGQSARKTGHSSARQGRWLGRCRCYRRHRCVVIVMVEVVVVEVEFVDALSRGGCRGSRLGSQTASGGPTRSVKVSEERRP